jgi:hypothetical protein
MPTYTVNRRSWFPGLGLVEAGTPIEYDGMPGTNLDATDSSGEKAKEEAARLRQATAAAQQAARQLAQSFQQASAEAFRPPESSFKTGEDVTLEAPEARMSKSGVLKPADQVPEGDTPGPAPSLGGDIPPDSTTFVPAGVVSQPTAEDEDEPAPKPRSRRKPAEE